MSNAIQLIFSNGVMVPNTVSIKNLPYFNDTQGILKMKIDTS